MGNKILPYPTKMFVIDPLRLCPLRCKACYNLHDDMISIKSLNQIFKEIDEGIKRGNIAIQITGGEPLVHPQFNELITYIKSKNLWTSIITSCYCKQERIEECLNLGINDFLISVHGLEDTHNKYTQINNAREKQILFLNKIKDKIPINFNCVINHDNQLEIYELSQWMLQWNPKIVNFINMNPHGSWGRKIEETKKVIADLIIVQPLLEKSIELLENNNIGVNIRYYPMCRINEKYRKNICNDLHVVFDWREWDYNIYPKNYETFRQWGINTSNGIENKNDPCNKCSIHNICGGINKAFHIASDKKIALPITDFIKEDFYYYRQHNSLALKENYI